MRRALWILLLLSPSLPALEIGDQLPTLAGKFLTGGDAVLPDAAAGKTALLVFGFTYQSRFPVEAWTKRFRSAFGAEPKVTFYEIPVIGGMGVLGKWFIDSGMRRGTPRADHEHVITVYGKSGDWKKRLNVLEPDAAYLVLLDKHGKVAWKYSGPFDEAQYAGLAAKCKELIR